MTIANSDELIRPREALSPASKDAWLRLSAGVLRQAAVDARSGSWGALYWLRSDDCAAICDLLGFDHQAIVRVARSWARPGKFVIKLLVGGLNDDRLYIP